MKVKNLIKVLESYDPEMEVYMPDDGEYVVPVQYVETNYDDDDGKEMIIIQGY